MEYVIIGNSAAGIGAVEGIRKTDKNGNITIVSREPYHTYSRPLISYLLQGKVTEERMKYRPENFYQYNNCRLIFASAAKVDAGNKKVHLNSGETLGYDKLLVSTGSSAAVIPFAGLETVENKFSFMSLDDAKKLEAVLTTESRVLIVGAGLVGLKCAEGICKRVNSVTVIDLADRILPAVLDSDGAKIVQEHIESAGVNFKLSVKVEKFDKNEALLSNGEKINFDALVLATGVRPNTDLLKGIANINRGIVINDKSETSYPDIYAAGDCTETLDISCGQRKILALLPNAYMQGECAGVNMAGGELSFVNAIPMNAAGFFGLHIITAGTYSGESVTQMGKTYKKMFYSDNKLNGYILIGNIEKAGIYTGLIREKTPLDSLDFNLICEYPGLMAFTKADRAIKLGGAK